MESDEWESLNRRPLERALARVGDYKERFIVNPSHHSRSFCCHATCHQRYAIECVGCNVTL